MHYPSITVSPSLSYRPPCPSPPPYDDIPAPQPLQVPKRIHPTILPLKTLYSSLRSSCTIIKSRTMLLPSTSPTVAASLCSLSNIHLPSSKPLLPPFTFRHPHFSPASTTALQSSIAYPFSAKSSDASYPTMTSSSTSRSCHVEGRLYLTNFCCDTS